MAKTELTQAQLMREFYNKMQELYDLAESLRDYAGGKDKNIFNLTRGRLYDLTSVARDQAYRWEAGEFA
jgi:hypothetical protein